jgi:hypothetical protein
MTLSVYSVASGNLIQVSDSWSASSSQGNINVIQCQYFGAFPAGDTIYMLLTSTGTVDIKLGTFFSGHLIG